MKIYFAGSIRGGRDDKEIYFAIITELGKYGTVLTEHVGDKKLSSQGEVTITDKYIFDRDMSWVKESDLIVAEITTPSLGVGYEIGQAQSMGKPILCIFRQTEGKRLSAMMAGNSNLKNLEYKTIEDISRILKEYFKRN